MLRKLYNIVRMHPVKRKSSLKRLSVLDRIRMGLGFRMLLVLKKRYEAYAFSDEIRVASGNEVLKFEFRDLGFERELTEQGLSLELRPSLHPRRDVYISPSTRQTRRSAYSDFDCTCTLTVRRVLCETMDFRPKKKTVQASTRPANITRRIIVPISTLLQEEKEEPVIEHLQGAEVDQSF